MTELFTPQSARGGSKYGFADMRFFAVEEFRYKGVQLRQLWEQDFWILRDQPNVVSIATMLSVEKELFKASPVQTARFRSSWIATKDSPSDEDPITRKRQSEYRLSGKKFRRKGEYHGKNGWKGGYNRRLWLSNNVPYSMILREGGPPYSVPPGWIDAAIKRGVKKAEKAKERKRAKRMNARMKKGIGITNGRFDIAPRTS